MSVWRVGFILWRIPFHEYFLYMASVKLVRVAMKVFKLSAFMKIVKVTEGTTQPAR